MIIGGRVENVTVNGSISSNGDVIAGIVGNIKNGTIYKCTNNASISGDLGSYHAGIAGHCVNTTIQLCENSGSIRGKYLVAGIVGDCYDNSRILECRNKKDITACGTREQAFYTSSKITMSHAGGISGALWNTSTISSCANEGSITTSTAFDVSNAYICLGGISGVLSQNSTIEKSDNNGEIVYKGKHGIIGGIVGYSVEGTINQCYNIKAVKGNYINGHTPSGGIVGWYDGGTVKNCYNTATIEAGFAAGGIAGGADSMQTKKKSYIYNCYSTNTSISGSNLVGTFMGSLTNMEIKNCGLITNTKYTGIEHEDLTWTSWKFFTVAEMQTIGSGLLTMLNSNEGTENGQKLWAQDSKNSGFPYLRYNNP